MVDDSSLLFGSLMVLAGGREFRGGLQFETYTADGFHINERRNNNLVKKVKKKIPSSKYRKRPSSKKTFTSIIYLARPAW